MQGDSTWVELLLRKAWHHARNEMEQFVRGFGRSLEGWLGHHWPTLHLGQWRDPLDYFLSDWQRDGITLEPHSYDELVAWLQAWEEHLRGAVAAAAVQAAEPERRAQSPITPLDDLAAQLPEEEEQVPPPSLMEVCFPAGTLIMVKDRGAIPIETVIVGDEVLAAHHADPEGPTAWKPVIRTYRNSPLELVEIHCTDGRVIRSTLDHPFYVRSRDFIAAGELKPGDQLRTADEGWVAVSETFRNGDIEPVCNLCVEGWHTHFAAGTLVHNQSFLDLEPQVGNTGPSYPIAGQRGLQESGLKVIAEAPKFHYDVSQTTPVSKQITVKQGTFSVNIANGTISATFTPNDKTIESVNWVQVLSVSRVKVKGEPFETLRAHEISAFIDGLRIRQQGGVLFGFKDHMDNTSGFGVDVDYQSDNRARSHTQYYNKAYAFSLPKDSVKDTPSAWAIEHGGAYEQVNDFILGAFSVDKTTGAEKPLGFIRWGVAWKDESWLFGFLGIVQPYNMLSTKGWDNPPPDFTAARKAFDTFESKK